MKKIFVLVFIFTILNLFAREVKVGMSADLSASISYLGNSMKNGIESYFNAINKSSNIKYKLISYDDKYDPVIASNNVEKLIKEDKVVAFLGNTGTPTTTVTLPLINRYKIPLIGAYSGAKILREETTNNYSFNFRVGYYDEVKEIVLGLLNKGLKINEFAIFSQNDTYGDSGYQGAVEAFRISNLDTQNIIHERYKNNTTNIEYGLSKLLEYNVDFKAFIMVGVNEPTIKFIKYAKEDFPNAKFFLISAIDIASVVSKLKDYEEDIYSTQVVPVLNSDIQVAKKFKVDFKELFPKKELNLIAFEGYIIAKLFHETIKDLDNKEITSKNIRKSFENLEEIDIGLGFKSNFKNSKHQFSNKVWLTKIKNTELYDVYWKDLHLK